MGLVARLAGCRDPSRSGRAYPQAGTFATSSEKYGLLTVKGFPNKWGICDAFPGCYSLLGYPLVTVWFGFGSGLVILWFLLVISLLPDKGGRAENPLKYRN